MDDMEQAQEELRSDMDQLKDQMAQMMEILKGLEKKTAEGTPSAGNEGQQTTSSHPPGFTSVPSQNLHPQMVPHPMYQNNSAANPQEMHAQPFPLYGLPPGYTPPIAMAHQDMHHHGNSSNPIPASAPNPSNPSQPQEQGLNATEGPSTQPLAPLTIPYNFPQNAHPETSQPSHSENTHQPPSVQVGTQGHPLQGTTTFMMPAVDPLVNHPSEVLQSNEKLRMLEERLRAIEGGGYFGSADASDLCLVPNVVIPPKFKVPEFHKYRGITCPKGHLTMFCRKMASYIHDDKLLIHCFQDSLTGAASVWYTNLERSRIRCWKDLADAFLKQYKYNVDMAPDRMQLQGLSKKDAETFKEYAQRWREIAAQVEPPLSEKEMVAMFTDTLQSPFYDRMIGSVSSNFSDIVIIGERVEGGMRSGKIAQSSNNASYTRKPPPTMGKKKEGEAHAVTFDKGSYSKGYAGQRPNSYQPAYQTTYMPYPYIAATAQAQPNPSYPPMTPYQPLIPSQTQARPNLQPTTQPQIPAHAPPQQRQHWNPNQNTNQRRPLNNQERRPAQFDPIPMTYTQLLPQLLQNSLVTLCPGKVMEPPYPRGYDPSAKCDYHSGAVGHSTENCNALKFKVQSLINAKWLNFKDDSPNVGHNPLPQHGGPSINAIEEYSGGTVIRNVAKVQMPAKFIFEELCKAGLVQPPGKDSEEDACGLHPGAKHSIEDCEEFKQLLQGLMNAQSIQIGGTKEGNGVNAVEKAVDLQAPEKQVSRPILVAPKPLVIHYTKNPAASAPSGPRPITIQVPSPFPYKNDKAVPWRYEASVQVQGDTVDQNGASDQRSAVANIAGIGGMTRSGRVYSPEELQRDRAKEGAPEGKGKEKESTEEVKEYKREVSTEEACEFLKIVKQSEYKVIDQLNRIPARISILSLMLNSEPHRKLLLKILNEAHVSHDITPEKFGGVVGNITANNYLTFTDDEIPAEGTGHNKALHISVKCRDYMLARVLIDNGSSVNVMPKNTLAKLSVDGSYMRPSTMIVRAFDGSRSAVIGEIELPIQIGPCTFEISFQVMDILPAYTCLLGRPWIHSAGVVPSTLHQKLKFIVDNKLVIVRAEDDILVTNTSSSPYIEVAEEALETSFQSLEIVNATFVKEGDLTARPRLSRASEMMAKVMIKGGYRYGKGLGKDEKGCTHPIGLRENKDRFGLGYKPTKEDKKRVAAEKKERRWARLQNREPQVEGVPFCDIRQSFRSAGLLPPDQIAAIEDQVTGEDAGWVRLCPSGMELRNWEAFEFPVIPSPK